MHAQGCCCATARPPCAHPLSPHLHTRLATMQPCTSAAPQVQARRPCSAVAQSYEARCFMLHAATGWPMDRRRPHHPSLPLPPLTLAALSRMRRRLTRTFCRDTRARRPCSSRSRSPGGAPPPSCTCMHARTHGDPSVPAPAPCRVQPHGTWRSGMAMPANGLKWTTRLGGSRSMSASPTPTHACMHACESLRGSREAARSMQHAAWSSLARAASAGWPARGPSQTRCSGSTCMYRMYRASHGGLGHAAGDGHQRHHKPLSCCVHAQAQCMQ